MMRVLAAACLLSDIVFAGPERTGLPPLVAIPYFAWNNWGKGEMAVWIPYR